MKFEYAAATDVGRIRTNNEDAVSVNAEYDVAVLADGMGGYNAGEVASAMAVEDITSELVRWLTEASWQADVRDVRRAMEICVDNVNRTIFDASNTNPAYVGMGTTLVMTVRHGHQLIIGHVGDSRAYRWRSGTLTQLTKDHSLLQEQIDMGLITHEEAALSSNRNLVTRALGVEDAVLLDVQESPVQQDDIYLLCSDGLTDMVAEADIADFFSETEGLPELAYGLIDMANMAGGRDNISVVVIKARKAPKKSGAISKFLRK
ncbi:Stp1/IreP family PP2C-type Ser/Thr phosphatase [Ottowia sp.]|uniref:Stp1/IreP family PP2C-type Ser/Thr phosphatase n=1 Tax=Ottowia sp. TaxID=1898956 RepID=UPI003A8C3544